MRERPDLIKIAKANMTRWLENMDPKNPARLAIVEWQSILENSSINQIGELLIREDEEAVRLRQNAPFAGILTPKEVWDLKQKFSHAQKSS